MSKYEEFQQAAAHLAHVAIESKEFKQREKDGACGLYRNVRECASVDECRQAFEAAYKALGAPGDFGYGSPEGKAMQRLYAAWNAALTERREQSATAAIDRVAMGA